MKTIKKKAWALISKKSGRIMEIYIDKKTVDHHKKHDPYFIVAVESKGAWLKCVPIIITNKL